MSKIGKLLAGLGVALMAMLGYATAAGAQTATPPDAESVAETAIAAFGDAAVDVFLALITNTWVLGLFALGIALAFAARVIGSAKRKTRKPVAS